METHAFQAETQKLLGLMIHSLYSNKEVFLRELISNASDALDRRRFEGLRNPASRPRRSSRSSSSPTARPGPSRISDNGIGMSRAELIEHLGTIARSGTLEFLKRTNDGRRRGARSDRPVRGRLLRELHGRRRGRGREPQGG